MAAETETWVCTVCGYVHTGTEAPDCCVVCGATRDLFEPYQGPDQATTSPSQWRCLNCNYIHQELKPPETCIVCGAPADRFEPFTESVQDNFQSDTSKKIVIVGAGIAGVSAAEALRKNCPQSEITLLNKEKLLPYYRLNLTRYLAGECKEDQLTLHSDEWYQENNIQILIR